MSQVIRNVSHWTHSLQSADGFVPAEYAQRGLWGRHVGPLLQMLEEQQVRRRCALGGVALVIKMPRICGVAVWLGRGTGAVGAMAVTVAGSVIEEVGWAIEPPTGHFPRALLPFAPPDTSLRSSFRALTVRLQGQRDEDLLVELLGTLNNLTPLDLPRTARDPSPSWASVSRVGPGAGILNFIAKCDRRRF